MTKTEILAKLTAILNKINDNSINAWEDNLADTKSVVITDDFNKNLNDEEHPEYDPELDVKYNGWLEELEALEKELKEEKAQEGNIKMTSAWDFVSKYYPNYYSSNEIARADDLQKLLDGEINGCAERILNEEYGGDEENPQIQIDYDALHREIYEEAMENYLSLNDEKL